MNVSFHLQRVSGGSSKVKDVISIEDISTQTVHELFALAIRMKKSPETFRGKLAGKSAVMLFEKPSLRTRVTFEVGIASLGGYALYMGGSEVSLGKRESVEDAARNLERWVDLVVARVFSHNTLVKLAANSKIPIINALSDIEHPCQALADLLTIHEHKGDLAGLKLAFVGDANNVCNSLFLLGARLGMNLVQSGPKEYQCSEDILVKAGKSAVENGGSVAVCEDPVEAVKDADAVYTDVWTSMGQESEKAAKDKAFKPYQVNAALMSHAKPDALFMHCLPAHRGEEVTDEIMDGPHSVVFDEAENRLHAQKALILKILGGDVEGGAGWKNDTRV